jgi:hypothetical protein
MKKAFFAGIVALLALTMITCDLFPPAGTGSSNNIKYDTDGTPLVNLTIGTGSAGRALTAANAETYTDFYEVVFKGPNGKIFRATWRAGQKGRIAVPFGDYAATDPTAADNSDPDDLKGAAILFAGRNNDRTLLGVGKLTHINEATGTTIDSATTSVTFTLEALENDIKAASGGSFEVTTSGAGTPANVNVKSALGTITIPLFPVVAGTGGTAADNEATWTVTCNTGADGVIIKGLGSVESVGIYTDAAGGFKIGAHSSDPLIDPSSGTLDAVSGEFTLSFSVPDTEGLSSLFIDIPVCALDTTSTTFPETWHIRGGLKNFDYDEGITPAPGSLGGAILIGTTAHSGTFEVTGKF